MWNRNAIVELGQVVTGSTPSKKIEEYYGGEIPWVKPPDLGSSEPIMASSEHLTELGASKARLVPEGAVLVGCIGNVGLVGIAGCALATNQQINSVVFDKDLVMPKFGYYSLLEKSDVIKAKASKAVVPILNKGNFQKIELPVPHPKEQARIVELLDQADALRKLRSQADEKAARILPALFHHYFGDPQSHAAKSNIKTDDVILDTQYGTSQSASKEGLGVPVLRMNNIEYWGDLNLESIKTVELSPEDRKRYELQAGDLLFNRTNSADLVGKVGLWNEEIESAVPASYLIRFRVDTAKVLPEFIWAYMNSEFFKNLLKSKARRAIGMANINAQELRSFPAFKPDMDAQLKFRSQLHLFNNLKSTATASKQKLEDLFQLLLHRAFTEELTAKWREEHMSELVEEMELQAKG